ncbi:universal stress protein [Phenylobacterium aquaticum]|uniref:universal stress protein n=1 Tax=Phenylobacterium aquaticum TaxID=1763816 RepID=UPI001F5D3E79|nr:universal stress protein [Phenylobacterium aquaticum]MCI3130848.1 universal stress protein [Phenylobacterium aquaticum]
MTYVSLLVPVEADPAADSRLALAVSLANRFQARLIGVGAEMWRTPILAAPFDGGYGVGELIAAGEAQAEADLNAAERRFKAAAGAVAAGSAWLEAVRWPLNEVAAEACAADLIVTSRGSHAAEAGIVLAGLVLEAGRPVLIAPRHKHELKLQTVLVAWKDAREARRAVMDAVPLLKRADRVIVAGICPHEAETATAARLEQVSDYLQRHGVRASTKVSLEVKGVGPADQLLELADEVRPDLIVAGAYGHTRLQEWVFGGFTKALLAQEDRAVLLSH